MKSKQLLILGVLSILIACGGSSEDLKSKTLLPLTQKNTVESAEVSRASEIISKKPAELVTEKKVPFHTFTGLKTLLTQIEDKIFEDSSFQAIEEQLWLALDSLNLRTPEEKKILSDLLDNLSLLSEDAHKAINLYRESEGEKPISGYAFIDFDNEEIDINKKNIISRRNVLVARNLLQSSNGYHLLIPQTDENKNITNAAQSLIRENMSSSLGNPVSYFFENSQAHLPKLSWQGELKMDFGGTIRAAGDYIPGHKYGKKKEWNNNHGQSSAHTYLTPNMATSVEDGSSTYMFKLRIQVKGGGVKKWDGGFKNKTARLSYQLSGGMLIPACDDLSSCSPFLVLKPVRNKKISGTKVNLKVNDVLVNGTNEYLIDRTQGDTLIEVEVSGAHSHKGKSGAINNEIALSFKILERNQSTDEPQHIKNMTKVSDYLNLNDWKSLIDSSLKGVRREERGIFIYRILSYLDRSLKDDLNATQLNANRVLNNYLILKAHESYLPIIEELIIEKRKNIRRFPITELTEVINRGINLEIAEKKTHDDFEKLRSLLDEFSERDLQKHEIDLELINEVKDQRNLIKSLYANLHRRLGDLLKQWQEELTILETELAQLTHLVSEYEETEEREYEIH